MSLPILLFSVLVTARCAAAQPSPSSYADSDTYGANFNATTAILIVVVVSGFFFLAFFSVYFRRCSWNNSAVAPATAAFVAAASRRGARRGLDPVVIETFPILSYSAASGLKIGKEALECAVCLSEFAGDEALRMLPRCCHVFHPPCIDTWLVSHVTCPVCRDDLSAPASAGPAADGDGPEIPAADAEGSRSRSHNDDESTNEVAIDLTRIGRSHSTGHVTGGGDRFTLRLPEHVRREIVEAGKLRRSASVAAVFSGGGEGSLRRGYRGRSVWAGLSDRWASGILERVSTWRRGEAPAVTTLNKKDQAADGNGGGGGGDKEAAASMAVLDRVTADRNKEAASMAVFDRV